MTSHHLAHDFFEVFPVDLLSPYLQARTDAQNVSDPKVRQAVSALREISVTDSEMNSTDFIKLFEKAEKVLIGVYDRAGADSVFDAVLAILTNAKHQGIALNDAPSIFIHFAVTRAMTLSAIGKAMTCLYDAYDRDHIYYGHSFQNENHSHDRVTVLVPLAGGD